MAERTNREAFSAAVRQARERRGWLQGDLGRQLGRRSQASISAVESGKSVPAPEDVFRLEQVLGLDPGTLSRHLGYLPVSGEAPSTEAAIRADPHLRPRLREPLVAIYYALRESIVDEDGAEAAIRADPHLTPRLRDPLVSIYFALRESIIDEARTEPRGVTSRRRQPR